MMWALWLLIALLIPVGRSDTALNKSSASSASRPKHRKCDFLNGIYASMMRNIYNPGFHKDLSTEIELLLTTSTLPERCRLVVEETFSRGMYVDLDQLRDLEELKGLKTFTSAKINVETPAFESESFRLYIFVDLTIQENLRLAKIELPIHLRYQKPRFQTVHEKKKQEQPSAVTRLQNPRLLLNCYEEEIAENCPDRVVHTFCDNSGSSQCEYLHIPYKANVNAIEVSTPVGNSEHTPWVVGVTTLVISGGTIYLLGAIFRQHSR